MLTIKGHVRRNGVGVAGAKVYWRSRPGAPWALVATTDENGYYETKLNPVATMPSPKDLKAEESGDKDEKNPVIGPPGPEDVDFNL